MNKPNVIPSGSRAPEPNVAVNEAVPPTGESANVTAPVVDEQGTTTTEAVAEEPKGRFKDMSEAEKAVANLESVLGRQGQELGSLRETTQQMMNALAAKGNVPTQAQQESPDFNAKLGTLMAQVNEGDIDFGEALMQAVTMVRADTEQAVEKRTAQQFQEYDQKRSASQQYERFLGQNPDYEDVVASGNLEAIKKANPMHDNFSAYYVFKAEQASKAAYEKGRSEAAALAKGTEQTRKVLNKPGTNIQQTNEPAAKAKDRGELNDRLTMALRKARGQEV